MNVGQFIKWQGEKRIATSIGGPERIIPIRMLVNGIGIE